MNTQREAIIELYKNNFTNTVISILLKVLKTKVWDTINDSKMSEIYLIDPNRKTKSYSISTKNKKLSGKG